MQSIGSHSQTSREDHRISLELPKDAPTNLDKAMKPKLAFVGAGKMVTAMVEGLLRNEIFSPDQMVCTSAPDGTSEKLSESTGIGRSRNTLEELLALAPERVLLGCKPYQLAELDTDTRDACEGSLVLSIMAGKTLDEPPRKVLQKLATSFARCQIFQARSGPA